MLFKLAFVIKGILSNKSKISEHQIRDSVDIGFRSLYVTITLQDFL